MVLITQRLKRGPVDSRVGMFPEVFGMADGRSEITNNKILQIHKTVKVCYRYIPTVNYCETITFDSF